MSRAARSFAVLCSVLLFFAACGGDDEVSDEDAVALLTTELQTTAGLPEDDARCVSEAIVDEIGVDGLEEIGLQSGGDGDFENLSDEEQAELMALVQQSFEECGVANGVN